MSESRVEHEIADPKERFDDLVREYIDFVNQQVGADALAGFAGHYTRVERQVHRVLRSSRRKNPATPAEPVVWTSYEDPTQPQATLVFLFTYWEEDIRPRLAASSGVEKNAVRSDVMGDLRTIRHAILHAKGMLWPDKHKGLKVLGGFFEPDRPLRVSYDDVHKIFVLVKRDCARLMFGWLGVPDPAGQAAQLVDVAIQRQAPPGGPGHRDVP